MSTVDPFYINDVFQCIQQFDFTKNSDVHQDYLCQLCNRILNNACVTPCNCRFCLNCIGDYLNNDQLCCPGSKRMCRSKLIGKQDVRIDKDRNMEILRLPVRCPFGSCSINRELQAMVEHIQKCSHRSTDTKMANYPTTKLDREAVIYGKMLVESYDRLKENIESIKADLLTTKNLLKRLVEDQKMFVQQTDFKKMTENIVDVNKRALDTVQKELSVVKNELSRSQKETLQSQAGLQEVVKKIQTMDKVQTSLNDHMNQMNGSFNTKAAAMEQRQNIMSKYLDSVNERVESQAKEVAEKEHRRVTEKLEKKKVIQDMNSDVRGFKSKVDRLIDRMSSENLFLWNIEDIKGKRHLASKDHGQVFINSGTFFSYRNGYKMSLHLFPNGDVQDDVFGQCISIYFVIVKGEFDDILRWPFPLKVKLTLYSQLNSKALEINSMTLMDAIGKNSKTSFYKPKNDANHPVGFSKFITWVELEKHLSIAKSDTIVITCETSDFLA